LDPPCQIPFGPLKTADEWISEFKGMTDPKRLQRLRILPTYVIEEMSTRLNVAATPEALRVALMKKAADDILAKEAAEKKAADDAAKKAADELAAKKAAEKKAADDAAAAKKAADDIAAKKAAEKKAADDAANKAADELAAKKAAEKKAADDAAAKKAADELAAKKAAEKNTCTWAQEMKGTYIPGCSKNCEAFSTLSDAQAACAVEPTCGGVTYSTWGSKTGFQLRQGPGTGVSPIGERTWQKGACATAEQTCTSWSQEMPGKYIPGCSNNCQAFSTLSDAQAACAVQPTCGGVTYSSWGSKTGFQLRQGPGTGVSPTGERTWQKVACATAEQICTWAQEMQGTYIPGCSKNCQAFSMLSDAQAACAAEPTCGGVTYSTWGSKTGFQLRQGPGTGVSPIGERTWQKVACATAGAGCKVEVFQHGDFSGWKVQFGIGSHNFAQFLAAGAKNDEVSAIKVFGAGCEATLFEHEFSGWQATFGEGIYDVSAFLAKGAHNDHVSSLKVIKKR